MKTLVYPLVFDGPESLDRYLAGLEIRIRRKLASQNPRPDSKPLDERERRAYDILYRKVTSQLRQKQEEERLRGEATLKKAIEVIGERGMLDSFLSAPHIMGVPYKGFILNALICLISFVLTSNVNVVFFAAPVIHAAMYFYFIPILTREREENIGKILEANL